MKYSDIKDQIVEITSSLELLPAYFIESLIERYWGIFTFMNTFDVKDLQHPSINVKELRHPSITCTTHFYMRLDANRYHAICTIKVDDVPAFFFVTAPPKTRYNNYYILNAEATKSFIRHLVSMSLERALENADIPVVGESQHIPGIPGEG